MASVSEVEVEVEVSDELCRDLGPDLGWGLITATRAFQRLAAEAAADLPGGTRGYLVLQTAAKGQPQSQLALARELGIDKTVMTYLLDELEAADLIERRPDPNDRRARRVQVTSCGHGTLDRFREHIARAEAELLAPLTGEQAAGFRDALERIARTSQTKPDSICTPVEPC